MNIIDFILLLIISVALWRGMVSGFFAGMAGLVSWVGSLVLTFFAYRRIAAWFGIDHATGLWAIPLSFLITLLVFAGILAFLSDRVLKAIPVEFHQHRLNRLLGAIPGLAMGLLGAAITASLLLLLPLSDKLTSYTRGSAIAKRLTVGVERLEQLFAPALATVNRSIHRMTIPPESSESVRLPFSVSTPTPRPALESEMLHLINAERAKADLTPVLPDDELRRVARQHAADMFANGYFSHISPGGDTPFDRIRQASIPFLVAGENLAIAQTLPLAHEGLMNSPGHRANILRPAFGRVGIGILDGGMHGLMVTQLFRN